METADPTIDGYLIRLDDLALDEVLQSRDTAITDALRDLLADNAVDSQAISAFNNFI